MASLSLSVGKYEQRHIPWKHSVQTANMFFVEESIEVDQNVSTNGDFNGKRDINEQNNEAESDNDKILRSIDNTIVLVETCPSNQEPDASSALTPLLGLTFSNASQNKEKITTTDTRPSSDRHLSEWNRDQVFGWFQSYKLDELYTWLFLENDTKDGANLKEIFNLKLKNYELYKVKYKNRLPSDKDNLLKEFDRFGQLLDTYFIDKYAHRFDVAFSFPGDIRDRVSKIAEKLCEKVNKKKIFYDNYHKVELARPNLDLYLQTIYRYQTRLIVVFMCADYTRKEWCGLESRAIRSLLKTDQSDRIMLLTVDGKTIDGVFDIDGYLDISNDSDDYVADAIYERLDNLGEALPSSLSLRSVPPSPLQPSQESILSKVVVASKNNLNLILSHIIVGLLSYIWGTRSGR
ncbi:unnamed protein product [Adineta steineri]|uniref:TIR domain-containing protein n=1 Tax=Adineta steineri TaxID=433720 RepID=A0A814FUP0_9BILA|nr:unnamed protein product [Adineta steineri]CAF4020038.1 unnamed protein product [Adineta steineri]